MIFSFSLQKWTGIFIEILDILSAELNFAYVLNQPKVKVYSDVFHNSWDGVIGEVHNKLHDFSIADSYATLKRSEVFFKNNFIILFLKDFSNN